MPKPFGGMMTEFNYKVLSFEKFMAIQQGEEEIFNGKLLEFMPYNQLRSFVMSQIKCPEGQTLAPGAIVLNIEDNMHVHNLVMQWLSQNFREEVKDIEAEARAMKMVYGPNITTDPSVKGSILIKEEYMELPNCSRGCGGCG